MKNILKILHLEDSSHDAELVKRCLKNARLDCEIKVVDTKVDFQNSLKYFNPDVILSDHSMPQFNSNEALRITQIRKSNAPFILVTGAVSEEFAAACIKNGADDYILKKNLARLPSAISHAMKHREAEKNLINSEKKFRDLFESNPMPTWVLDLPTFRFLSVNAAAVKHYGYSKQEFLSMTALDIRPEEEKEKFINIERWDSAPYHAGVWKHSKKDGTIIHAEIRASQIVFDGKPARLVLSNDVTELVFQNEEKAKRAAELGIANKELAFQSEEKRKRAAELFIANTELVFQNQEKEKRADELSVANEELQKAKEELMKSEIQIRNFAAHLNKVLEEERAGLAREIHDELGQQLVGIKIGLSSLKQGNTVSEDGSPDVDSPAWADEKINGMMQDVDNTLQSLRKIATALRPGILDTMGLIPSIKWLAKGFEKKTNIKCHFSPNTSQEKFEKNISTCFFRICQEALTNISKHAEASEVNIRVNQKENELIMKISDNGKGIATEKLENPFSMGLLGMRERANILGARLLIMSQKDLGTTIQLMANVN